MVVMSHMWYTVNKIYNYSNMMFHFTYFQIRNTLKRWLLSTCQSQLWQGKQEADAQRFWTRLQVRQRKKCWKNQLESGVSSSFSRFASSRVKHG